MPKQLTALQQQQAKQIAQLRACQQQQDRLSLLSSNPLQWQQEGPTDGGSNGGQDGAEGGDTTNSLRSEAQRLKKENNELLTRLSTLEAAIGNMDPSAVQPALARARELEQSQADRTAAIEQAKGERDKFYSTEIQQLKDQIAQLKQNNLNLVRNFDLNRVFSQARGTDFGLFEMLSSRYFKFETDDTGKLTSIKKPDGTPFAENNTPVEDPLKVFDLVRRQQIGDRTLWSLFEEFDQSQGTGSATLPSSTSYQASQSTTGGLPNLTEQIKAAKNGRGAVKYPGE